MNAAGRVLGAVAAGAVLTACAAISGVSDYSEGNATDASLSADVRVPDSGHADAPSNPDSGTPFDATAPFEAGGDDDSSPEQDSAGEIDTGSSDDASPPAEASASDDGSSSEDAAGDGAPPSDGEAPDAGVADTGTPDAGPTCSSTHTVLNCSACGAECDTSTGTPSCNGSTCSYACNPGRADCNFRSAPDTDGCECATPVCCSGGTCETAHSNGQGQTFYDCTAPRTYNQTQAQSACAAFTGNGLFCVTPSAAFCGTLQQTTSVCSNVPGATTYYCWEYAGPSPGTVQKTTLSNAVVCPASGDPTWN